MELISREEVKRIIECTTGYHPAIKDAFDRVMELPIIESRPKGKWVKYKGEIYGFECSVCGKPAPLESEYGAYPCEKTNYCPYCSADMRGEK